MAWAVALTRGLHLVAILSLFGTLLVAWLIKPAACGRDEPIPARLDRELLLLVRGSAVLALTSAVAWLLLEAAEMAGAASLGEMLSATPIALFDTRFGQALMVRCAAVLATGALAGRIDRRGLLGLAVLTSAIAVIAQSWMGHPAAADGLTLLLASVLHLLAAGAWLGALVPLFLVVRATTPGPGPGRAAARFSWIGQVSVLVLAVTAFLQGRELIGDEGGLFGTDYGQFATFKLALFLLLFLIAVVNRFKLTPALESGTDPKASRHLMTSIAIETVLGLLVVFAAAWLATLTPATHQEPVWPFPLRPNKDLLADADVRNAFIEAGILLLAAVCLFGRSVLFRRWRWPVLAAAAALVWYSNKVIDDAPFLDPMLIEAYPTSYVQSPSGFTTDSIAQGAHLFAENCVPCHGADGRGDGPAAASLPVRPANLTQEHVWGHSDGEMFWWLTKGIAVGKHGTVMPAFGEMFSEDERWALIDFIHAHLAGATMADKGLWTVPVAAPSLAAVCSDGKEVALEDLRGKYVRVVIGDGQMVPVSSTAPVIVLAHQRQEIPGCVAEGDTAWAAYAVLAHVAPDKLAGTQFLIDPAGWVRWVLPPDKAAAWASPEGLQAVIRDVAAHPLAASSGGHHHHH